MKAVNFGNITLKDIERNQVTLDIRKQLGNSLYIEGQNIEECDLGRKIYYSDGDVELTPEQVEIVKRYTARYAYIARQAILDILA